LKTGELSDRVGEIIEAGTTDFTAQCYQLYKSPSLGSLVKASDAPLEIYGIVANAATAGIEPGRRPIARGRDEVDEEAVYRSSPQLEKLLRTEFEVLVVGYKEDEKLFRFLPPRPARIHGFVYQCSPDEVREFSQSFDFLSLLLNARFNIPVEELVAASLRQMSRVHEDSRRFLVAAGKELAVLLGGEFNRLKSILKRIE